MILRKSLATLAFLASLGLPAAGGTADPPTLKLLDAGAEPRAPLRYAPRFGFDQVVTLKMKTKMETTAGGREIPGMAVPGVTLKMTVKIDLIDDNGDITYTAVVDGAAVDVDEKVPPQVAEPYQKMAKSVNGSRATVKIDARGNVKSSKVTPAAGADPKLSDQVTKQFTRVAMPLPEEPVGAGAKWSFTKSETANGAATKIVTTLTLGADEGGVRRLDMKIAGKMTMKTPQGSFGTKIGGGGKAEWTAAKLAPLGYSEKVVSSTEIPAGPQTMKTTTTALVKMKSSE